MRHLHAFLREVRPTEAEWMRGIEFLTAVGHMTDERRQEFILLSDVLGASMQTITINNPAPATRPRRPSWARSSTRARREIPLGGDIAQGRPGSPVGRGHRPRHARGPRPRRPARRVGGRRDGLYDMQYDDDRLSARGLVSADDEGATPSGRSPRRPTRSPTTAPSATCCAAAGRSPMRASHLHFLVRRRGSARWSPTSSSRATGLLDRDPCSASASRWSRTSCADGEHPTPDARDLDGRDWSRVRFDIVLAPAEP